MNFKLFTFFIYFHLIFFHSFLLLFLLFFGSISHVYFSTHKFSQTTTLITSSEASCYGWWMKKKTAAALKAIDFSRLWSWLISTKCVLTRCDLFVHNKTVIKADKRNSIKIDRFDVNLFHRLCAASLSLALPPFTTDNYHHRIQSHLIFNGICISRVRMGYRVITKKWKKGGRLWWIVIICNKIINIFFPLMGNFLTVR